MDRDQLESIQRYVYEAFKRDATGHDFYHMQRVVKLSGQIAEAEHADIALCEAAAWLHDIGDHKLFDNPEIAKKEMQQFLRSIAILESDISDIMTIIDGVSYSKGETVPATLEGTLFGSEADLNSEFNKGTSSTPSACSFELVRDHFHSLKNWSIKPLRKTYSHDLQGHYRNTLIYLSG